jgi:hypothetical protein
METRWRRVDDEYTDQETWSMTVMDRDHKWAGSEVASVWRIDTDQCLTTYWSGSDRGWKYSESISTGNIEAAKATVEVLVRMAV